jgi:glycosyltransferase involved in cell wall biosynthesis
VATTRPTYSVVIPARDGARTLGAVLASLATQEPGPYEVIVVDDASTDETPEIARAHGARVVTPPARRFAGGARNHGWDAAQGDVVVFLDADVVPAPDWGLALVRALTEFPGAIVGCARSFAPATKWQWVSHLQIETPYLPRGGPRDVRFVSSYCMAVPRTAPLRWEESYGGEDSVFCADALAHGLRLVFDPRIVARHDHGRTTFADLRAMQRRMAYALARSGTVQREGVHKRLFSRFPLHYFALVRLLLIYRRLEDPQLRRVFLRLLPRLVLAEWTLGASALRYVWRRPAVRETGAR